VRKDSPLKTLNEAKGKRWVFPETAAYMTKFCTAELRDRGIVLAKEDVKYVREQAAITFFLDNKFSDLGGIASYSGPAKNLDKNGFRVRTRALRKPYFPLIAGKPCLRARGREDPGHPDRARHRARGRRAAQDGGRPRASRRAARNRLGKLLTWLGGG